MNEYRLKITVLNNLLLSAIEQAGYESQSEFARATGLRLNDINNLVGLRVAPIGKEGEFIHSAKVIMEALGAAPHDLWTDQQLFMALNRNTGERPVSERFISDLLTEHLGQMTLPNPEDVMEEKEKRDVVERYLNLLTEHEAKIIRLRFGIGMRSDFTLKECGSMANIGKERTRQIETRALEKIRHIIKIREVKSLADEVRHGK